MKRSPSLVFLFLLMSIMPCVRPASGAGTEATGGDYVCFSLGSAAHILKNKTLPVTEEVRKLGFITKPVAIVVDPETRDCIVVGRREPNRPVVYLDDFVVALRAVYVSPDPHGPGVSIDPSQSSESAEKHFVRYFGGVEGTRFGRVCVDADCLLKEMDLGLVPTGCSDVITSWDVWSAQGSARDGVPAYPQSVSFFFPLGSGALFDSNTVSIGAFRPAVGAVEVKSESETTTGSNQFVESLNAHFPEVAEAHPVLKDLENLMCLYALCGGLDSLSVLPRLGYYLESYVVEPHETPRALDVLHRDVAGIEYSIQVNGDLGIRRGTIIRMTQGDPSATGRIVLAARPDPGSLVWLIELTESGIMEQPNPDMADQVDVAYFHLRRKEYGPALDAFLGARSSGGGSPEVLSGMALAYLGVGDSTAALKSAEEAVASDSTSAYAWQVQGEILLRNSELQHGIESLARAADLDPTNEEVACALGSALLRAEQVEKAALVFDRALSLHTKSPCALLGLADVSYKVGEFNQAYDRWMTVAKLGSDPATKRIAIDSIKKLVDEGRIHISSAADVNFPHGPRPGSLSMLGCALHFQFDYGYGRDFFDPHATVFVDRQQLRLTAPLSFFFVFRNRVRFALNVPFVIQIVPFEKPKCYDFGGTTVCTDSKMTVGVVGGLVGPDLFMSCLLSDGLMKKPLLIAHVGLVSPTRSPLFETYWSGEEGSWKGMIPFEHELWRGKIALQTEQRASSRVRFILNFSHEQNLSGDAERVTGWALGAKRRFGERARVLYIGTELSGITADKDSNIRLAMTLDICRKEEWQTFSLGVGSSVRDDSSSNAYFFISTGIGLRLIQFRRWL